MRNFKCYIADLRKRVFAEVARLAYEGGDYRREIVPGEVGNQRSSIFLERAIVGERIRLAMGLPLRPVAEHSLLSDGIEESAVAEKYYDPPLVNIIKYACNGCKPTHYEVTNACQGCLSRHCQNACPKNAIDIDRSGHACIDQSKCIKCGKCKDACSYQAIIKFTRPCQEACGMNAIGQDEYGHACIDYDKCVSCGMCLVNCPFGAIVDKGQLFQLIHAIRQGDEVVAVIAPAFWGQFGDNVTPGQIKAAMKQLGFAALENILYVAQFGLSVAVPRALLSVPGHFFFAVYMGIYLGEAKRAEREGEGFLRDRFLRESILVPVLLHGFWDFSLSVDSLWMTAAFYAFVLVFFLSANHRLRAASEDDQQL